MNHSHQTSAATLNAPQVVLRRRAATAPNLLTRLRETFGTWQRRRRSRRDLLTLDDHLLRDIGLTREQIAIESSSPFWRV